MFLILMLQTDGPLAIPFMVILLEFSKNSLVVIIRLLRSLIHMILILDLVEFTAEEEESRIHQ